MIREIALDTETTGLSPDHGDRITEIGCVEMVDKIPTGKTFQTYINPQRELSAKAHEITGLTLDFLSQFETFDKIAKDLMNFINGATLVMHNAPFDMKFLNFELRKCNMKDLSDFNVVDTYPLSKKVFSYIGSHSLDNLCKTFRIDISKREKHGALLDARLLADVYFEIAKEQKREQQKTPSMIDCNENAQKHESQNIPKQTLQKRTRKIEIKGIESDIEKHSKMVATKIPNAIWNKIKDD